MMLVGGGLLCNVGWGEVCAVMSVGEGLCCYVCWGRSVL